MLGITNSFRSMINEVVRVRNFQAGIEFESVSNVMVKLGDRFTKLIKGKWYQYIQQHLTLRR